MNYNGNGLTPSTPTSTSKAAKPIVLGLDFLDKAEEPKSIEVKIPGMVSKWLPTMALREGVRVIAGLGVIKFFKRVIMRSPDGTQYEASLEVTPRYVPGTVPPVHNSGEEGTLVVSVKESLGGYYKIYRMADGPNGKKILSELRTDTEVNEAARNHEFLRVRLAQTPDFTSFNEKEAVKLAEASEVKIDLLEVAKALMVQQQQQHQKSESEDSYEVLGEDTTEEEV